MKKLYTLSFARTATDSPRTGTLYFSQFTCLENNDWVLTTEESVSHLSRDEQLAHIDTLLSILCIPGNQEDDVGMSFDSKVNKPITPRIAIGVTEDVKELHTLVLTSNSEITNAAMNSFDERRFIQKDFITVVERLFKDVHKFNTPADIYAVQAAMLEKAHKALEGKPKAAVKSKLKKLKIDAEIVHIDTE